MGGLGLFVVYLLDSRVLYIHGWQFTIGVLGIELSTRRRNRMNGPIVEWDRDGFTVAVMQSFGNCPRYIQCRDCIERYDEVPVRAEPLPGLDDAARALILGADTCFAASAESEDRSADVSHRGGRAGFVGIAGDGAIILPDYRGNRFPLRTQFGDFSPLSLATGTWAEAGAGIVRSSGSGRRGGTGAAAGAPFAVRRRSRSNSHATIAILGQKAHSCEIAR